MSDLSDQDGDDVARCEALIGYAFRNKQLLAEALTHASGANTRLCSNERLEFLGDSVLGFLVCHFLYEQCPDLLEGDMTKIKSIVVSGQTCAQLAEKLGLRSVLRVGKGIGRRGGVPASLMSDVF
ncbi:MAG TPA: ribonuclease III domain-containing protein, partial [Pirellulaceae bacterium]|nr:ribonuclease III domain-containing protein [Pirellulaceae bacterium]